MLREEEIKRFMEADASSKKKQRAREGQLARVVAILLLAAVVWLYTQAAYAAQQVGVLSIPSAEISVALFDSYEQSVVDAQNSAAHFWGGSWIIADHNNQAFRTLKNVQPGDTATIHRPDGSQIHLLCADKYNGKNTGRELVNAHGRNVMADHDYLMYTCRLKGLGSRYIIITQWEVAE